MGVPPRSVYSAIVENKSDESVRLGVHYRMINGDVKVGTFMAPAGGRATIPERGSRDGEARHLGVIEKIVMEQIGEGHPRDGAGVIKAPFNVQSPTKNHEFIIDSKLRILEKKGSGSDEL